MMPGMSIQRKDKKKMLRVRHFRKKWADLKAIWVEVGMRERGG